MTISYELAPMPKWYIADLTGKPLGAGTMYTYSNLDKTVFKFIYQDPSGNFPWTDPVLFDENGSQGPFYWAVNSSDPTDLYYVEVYDAHGVLQWTIDNFIPPGGGGGSIITTAINIDNLVINNVMFRNIGSSANPTNNRFLLLAPGANTGLCPTNLQTAAPDIYFIKSNTAASDQLRFLNFTLGSNALTGDVTPVQYLNYACTNTPAGEVYKYVSFPITQGVQNLSNQNVVVTIWARCNSGNNLLTLQWYQFFGDGIGATPANTTSIQTLTLTTLWQKFVITTSVPNVSGANLGDCGNDGLFLQVQYPLGAATSIDFTKPSVYLGNISPTEDYINYDVIDGAINTARTGDVRVSMNSFSPAWVFMNDTTIGNTSSGATGRANVDTFPLFYLLWNNFAGNQGLAPMFTSAGAPIAYGGTPSADFSANRRLSLTKSLGRMIANIGIPSSGNNTGTSWQIGQTTGNELVGLTTSNLPSHSHSVEPIGNSDGGGGIHHIQMNAQNDNQNSSTFNTGNTGSGTQFNIQNPVAYYNFWIKL